MTTIRIISIVAASLLLAAVGRSTAAFADCTSSFSSQTGAKLAPVPDTIEKLLSVQCDFAAVLPDQSGSRFFFPTQLSCGSRAAYRPVFAHAYGYFFSGLSPP